MIDNSEIKFSNNDITIRKINETDKETCIRIGQIIMFIRPHRIYWKMMNRRRNRLSRFWQSIFLPKIAMKKSRNFV